MWFVIKAAPYWESAKSKCWFTPHFWVNGNKTHKRYCAVCGKRQRIKLIDFDPATGYNKGERWVNL